MHTTGTRGIRSPASRNAACRKPRSKVAWWASSTRPSRAARSSRSTSGSGVPAARSSRVSPWISAAPPGSSPRTTKPPGAGEVEPVAVDRDPPDRHDVVVPGDQPGGLDVERQQPQAGAGPGGRPHQQQGVVGHHAVGTHRTRPHRDDVHVAGSRVPRGRNVSASRSGAWPTPRDARNSRRSASSASRGTPPIMPAGSDVRPARRRRPDKPSRAGTLTTGIASASRECVRCALSIRCRPAAAGASRHGGWYGPAVGSRSIAAGRIAP